MAQTAILVSCVSNDAQAFNNANNPVINVWVVQIQYQLSTGGLGTYTYVTGFGGLNANLPDPTGQGLPEQPFWAGPQTPLVLNPQPANVLNGPLSVNVPPIIKWATFGVASPF